MTQCSLLSSNIIVGIFLRSSVKRTYQLTSNSKVARVMHCRVLFIPTVSTQNGESAVNKATVYCQPATLRELVRAGSDLNLQNQVKYTVTVDTAPHIIPSCPY